MFSVVLPILVSSATGMAIRSAFDEPLFLRPPPGYPTLAPVNVSLPPPSDSNWPLILWLLAGLLLGVMCIAFVCTRSATHCIWNNAIWKIDAPEEAEEAEDRDPILLP